MADTETTERTGLVLVDEHGETIEPKHVRAKLAGNVFLSYELEDLPPQHAEVEMTIRGKVSGFGLDEQKELGWVALVTVKAEKQTAFRILPPEDEDPTLLDDDRWAQVLESLAKATGLGAEQLAAAARYAREDLEWSVARFEHVITRAGQSADPWIVVDVAERLGG